MAAQTKRAPAPGRMWAPARRRQLLDVATDLAGRYGWEGLRMETLAAAAGVSKPVVYEHFPGRDALLVALIDDYGTLLAARTREAFAHRADNFEAAAAAVVHAYFDCVEERGAGIRRLLASSGGGPKVDQVRLRLRQEAAARWTERIVRHTGLRRADAAVLATTFVATIWSLAGQWLAGTVSRARAERLFVRMTTAVVADFRRQAP